MFSQMGKVSMFNGFFSEYCGENKLVCTVNVRGFQPTFLLHLFSKISREQMNLWKS